MTTTAAHSATTPAQIAELNRQIEAVRVRIRAFWDSFKVGDDKAPCDDVLMPELRALCDRLPPEGPARRGLHHSGGGKIKRAFWVE